MMRARRMPPAKNLVPPALEGEPAIPPGWPQPSARGFQAFFVEDGQGVSARFRGYKAASAFQPIYSIAHRKPVGYEALLRAYAEDGTFVSPTDVFAGASSEAETALLDGLCWSLHARNFLSLGEEVSWLFLNISPATAIHGEHYGEYLSELTRQLGLATQRLVIEVLEDAVADKRALAESVAFFKKLGCLVAIDDFGAGHSNFDRIWQLAPDIVKFDRSVIAQATRNPTVVRMLPNLVNLIHEAGCLALIEGIESEEEALIAVDSGIDFVQGYYFGRPAQNPFVSPTTGAGGIDLLCEKFKAFSEHKRALRQLELARYKRGLVHAARAIASGVPFEQACAEVMRHPRVERCFLLDQAGTQLDHNLEASHRRDVGQARFLPVAGTAGANWSRRPYFQRAIVAPGEVQCTRPYLSVTGARMCITLSLALRDGAHLRVLCCDLACDADSCL